MDEWINAKKTPPNNDGTYFARCDGYVFVGQYNKRLNQWKDTIGTSSMGQEVSHWLPIPPFKEND